jgi:hypothetical protein
MQALSFTLPSQAGEGFAVGRLPRAVFRPFIGFAADYSSRVSFQINDFASTRARPY